MDSSRRTSIKAAKNSKWPAYVIVCIANFEKDQAIKSVHYVAQMMCLKKKNVFFYQNISPCHKTMTTMGKIHVLHFELLPHSLYSPDLYHSDFYLYTDVKKCSQERDLNWMKLIAETVLKKRWNVLVRGRLK